MLRKGNAKGPEPPGSRGNEKFYTFHIHHGGTVVKAGNGIKYEGGTISIFDYVDVSYLSHELFNSLACQLGYNGPKKFYRVNSLGGICPIVHVVDILLSFDFKHFDVQLYVEGVKGKGKGGSVVECLDKGNHGVVGGSEEISDVGGDSVDNSGDKSGDKSASGVDKGEEVSLGGDSVDNSGDKSGDKSASGLDKGQEVSLGGDSAANSGERNEEARSFKRGNRSYVGRALGRRGKKSGLGRTLDKGKRKLIDEPEIDNFGEDFRSDNEDSDFNWSSGSEDELLDDVLFEDAIDREVEFGGVGSSGLGGEGNESELSSEVDIESSDVKEGTSAHVIMNDASIEADNVVEDNVDEPMSSQFIAVNPPTQRTKPKKGVNLRMPPPMTFHPNEAVTSQRQVGGESSSVGVPTMVIGGKKYVNMGNLQAAMVGKTAKKKKAGKKGK